MIVVSDTSPLCYLVLIGREGILGQLFGSVLTSVAVVRELMAAGAPELVRQWASDLPAWVQVRSPRLESKFDLDPGEASAIALANEVAADALLIDDRKGRLVAQANHIVTVGTLSLLEVASRRRLLELPEVIDDLLRTNFRVSDRLVREVLARDRRWRGQRR
jgi:predicted nucleic acid-binding protein